MYYDNTGEMFPIFKYWVQEYFHIHVQICCQLFIAHSLFTHTNAHTHHSHIYPHTCLCKIWLLTAKKHKNIRSKIYREKHYNIYCRILIVNSVEMVVKFIVRYNDFLIAKFIVRYIDFLIFHFCMLSEIFLTKELKDMLRVP